MQYFYYHRRMVAMKVFAYIACSIVCIPATSADRNDKSCNHLFGKYLDVAERTDDAKAEPGARHVIQHVFGWLWGTLAIQPDDSDNAFVLETLANRDIHFKYIAKQYAFDKYLSSGDWSCRDGTLRIRIKQDISEAHGSAQRKEWRNIEFNVEGGLLTAHFNEKSVGLGFGVIPYASAHSKTYRFIQSKDPYSAGTSE